MTSTSQVPVRSFALVALAALAVGCGSSERGEVARLEAENEALRARLADSTETEDRTKPPVTEDEEKPAADDWSWAEPADRPPEPEPSRVVTPAPVPEPEPPKPQPRPRAPEPKPEPTNRFEAPSPEPEPQPEPRFETLRASAGSSIEIATSAELSSQTAAVGDVVEAVLERDLLDGQGRVVLPAGTRLSGRVSEVQAARKVKKKSRVAFQLDTATLADGGSVSIAAGRSFEGEGWKKKDGAVIGGAAAGGALLGQVLGGDTESTAAGAAIGGAIASGVIMSKKGEATVVPAGSVIVLELQDELVVERPVG